MLKDDGWIVVRCRGDHRQLKNTKGRPGTVTVNGKESDTLSQELLNSIWKQAGWKQEQTYGKGINKSGLGTE